MSTNNVTIVCDLVLREEKLKEYKEIVDVYKYKDGNVESYINDTIQSCLKELEDESNNDIFPFEWTYNRNNNTLDMEDNWDEYFDEDNLIPQLNVLRKIGFIGNVIILGEDNESYKYEVLENNILVLKGRYVYDEIVLVVDINN